MVNGMTTPSTLEPHSPVHSQMLVMVLLWCRKYLLCATAEAGANHLSKKWRNKSNYYFCKF